MQKVIGWLLTPLHLLLFAAVLLVFHIAQVLALPFGYGLHKRVVDYLNFFVLASLKVMGTRFEFSCEHALPKDCPLVVVSNHQSMYDIPMLGWLFRDHHPKYIAKIELGKRLPSISYNLRHGGSVLIDRSDPRSSMRAIISFGKQVEEYRYAACIFPEGTRARGGVMKEFIPAGLMTLVRATPSATIVPVAIDGSWELMRYRMRPIPFGVRVKCKVLAPMDPGEHPVKDLAGVVEERIRSELIAHRQAGTTPGTTPGATPSATPSAIPSAIPSETPSETPSEPR
jgi:1-acyl-sn-glycerol-3-phosphate acyltransferase